MSFLSVLKNVGNVALGVGQAVLPVVSVLDPAVGAIATAGLNAVIKVEQASTQLVNPATSVDKKAAATQDVNITLSLVQSILNGFGVSFNAQDPALQKAIGSVNDASVALMNALADVETAIKAVKSAPLTVTPVVNPAVPPVAH